MAKSSVKRTVLFAALLAGLGAAGFLWWDAHGKESTDDATIEAHIIPVAPKVAGYVVELNIQDNQHVKKGDILLKIDPRDYQAAVDQAKADLDSAQARLVAGRHNFATTSVSAPSNLESAQSQVDAAQAEWNNAKKTLARMQELGDDARSRQSLDDAQAAEKSARSVLADAQARLRSAQTAPDTIAASEAAVKELEADVLKAQAILQLAQNNLDDTTITAAADGRITRRSVEKGAFVQAGQQLLSLVGDDMWVVANFKETQLTHMKPGQSVTIDIDAFPAAKLTGKIDSIQSGTGARFSLFPPENATGNFVKIVQRVPVKIVFDGKPAGQYQIGPGMSVVPEVHVQ